MELLEKLNKLNNVQGIKVYSVHDQRFKLYGRVVEGYNFDELMEYMETKSEMPEIGNVYKASVGELEETDTARLIKNQIYGEMEIEVGYCNGRNSTFNGMEYHKGSEVNVAVTDLMLILGHTWDVTENTYSVGQAEMFFLKKGEAIEMYQTTLHLSPCKTSKDGFKCIVILPEGTNTPLTEEKKNIETADRLLLQKNKWVIAHPDREPLIKQGAFPGILGPNLELLYD